MFLGVGKAKRSRMNRRNFFGNLLKAGAAFSILPSAMLYARTWKFQNGVHVSESRWIENPNWVKAEYEIYFYDMPPMFDEAILL